MKKIKMVILNLIFLGALVARRRGWELLVYDQGLKLRKYVLGQILVEVQKVFPLIFLILK